MQQPETSAIATALDAAAEAHHAYEKERLNGETDEQWAGFYAAFVLGRLGPFMPISHLTQCLETVTSEQDWSAAAARKVMQTAGKPEA